MVQMETLNINQILVLDGLTICAMNVEKTKQALPVSF